MVRTSGDIQEGCEEPSADLTGGSPIPTTLKAGCIAYIDLGCVENTHRLVYLITPFQIDTSKPLYCMQMVVWNLKSTRQGE